MINQEDGLGLSSAWLSTLDLMKAAGSRQGKFLIKVHGTAESRHATGN